MNIKPLITLASVALIILIITTVTKSIYSSKHDVILKQNDKSIYVKEYKTYVKIEKNCKNFRVTHDSMIYKYKQNKILYDGILKHAQHKPHIVIIKTTKKIKKNNKTYQISKNERAEEIFSCDQIAKLKNNIGKRIVITKIYYPRERIFYKFP